MNIFMKKLIMKIHRKKAARLSIYSPCRMKKIGINKNPLSLMKQVFPVFNLKIDLSLRNHKHLKFLMPVQIKDHIRPCRITHLMKSYRQLNSAMLLFLLILFFFRHPRSPAAFQS